MDETICQLPGVCYYLGQHPAHCDAIAAKDRPEAGLPCVRAVGHAGELHAYGIPRGVTASASPEICGKCAQRWPGHSFECPQYQQHGTGAPPAPWPRLRPSVSYTTADCETCGASTGAPCVGLRYDEVHAMRFLRIEIAFLQSSTPSSSSAQQLLLPPAGGQ